MLYEHPKNPSKQNTPSKDLNQLSQTFIGYFLLESLVHRTIEAAGHKYNTVNTILTIISS